MSRLFYKRPSGWDYKRALPIGNGRLGAMIFGEADMEHYSLNEETLWSGKAMDRVNPDALPNLEKVRRLIFDGKTSAAERLLKYAFTSVPQGERVYQTAGDLYIDMMGTISEPVDFTRTLDLETAIHTITEKDARSGVNYTREAFVSADENVIATRISADRPASVSLAALATRGAFYDRGYHEGDCAYMEGCTGEDGMRFCVGLRVIARGAEVSALGEAVMAENADEAFVYVAIATDFNHADPTAYVRKRLASLDADSYETMREAHISEYRKYFDTCRLTLDYDRSLDELETDARLKRSEIDNGLITTYFDYGRYLLICSSRKCELPANLQGIWNDSVTPAWGSKFTININTEMNYWPTEPLGLSECHMPLFKLLKRLAVTGEDTARRMYGCRGFVAHHNTDIWADSAPQDMWMPATYWVMGGAWLCTHVWQHYEYTLDRDFLAEMYPVMKKAVLFFHDFLVEKDGYFVTCPSQSPENTFLLPNGESGCVSYGVTMDNQILRDLFSDYLSAAETVRDDDIEFIERTREMLRKLPPMRTGSRGQLLEWVDEYEEPEPGHRHISHLYGLHPSRQISREHTPELADAARVTLEERLSHGGGHTGWSRAWIINMYARLGDGEKAYENLIALLKNSTQDNLLDTHPPFQIDGNFGGTAAIGEMLLQTDGEHEKLLPALPAAFASGSVVGLRAPGGRVYDFRWENGKMEEK